MKKTLALAVTALLSSAAPSFAQMEDEVIVTASRISVTETDDFPGQFLTVPGDNLLLAVSVESDDRDAAVRYREISETIDAILEQASADSDISISFIDGNRVRPLTRSLFEEAIGTGMRPDTSRAVLQVKTPIPDTVPDAYALSNKLQRFVANIGETGRITVSAMDAVTVSVVDPRQYRPQVLALITAEIRSVTDALGPDYRVILSGIDGQMQSFRAGDLALGFYLPYEYQVIPDTLHSVRVVDEDY